MIRPWHCVQIPNGSAPIVVCERENLQKEITRLQSLIDAYTEAWQERVHAYVAREWGHGTDDRCIAADMALDAADDALRAAATPKGDDR